MRRGRLLNKETCKCKVAAIQMVSTDSVDTNLATMSAQVRLAASKGAELVVLPEYFSFIGQSEDEKVKWAEEDNYESGANTQKIQTVLSNAAKENSVWLIGGTCPIFAESENKVCNAMFVFDQKGNRRARYDKIHLFKYKNGVENYDESTFCEAGNQPLMVDTPAGKTFLSVCYDLRFPEFYRRRFPEDVSPDVIIVSAAFTRTTGEAHWEVLLRARAIENQAYVIASAQGGEHNSGRETWGHSMIIDPWGDIIAKCKFGKNIVLGEVDMKKLQTIRENLPALEHQEFNLRKRLSC